MHRIEGENVDVTTGVNLFKTTPPYTVITPELMNAIQEEIMYVISQAGMPLLNKSNDTRDQLWTAMSRTIQPYNYVVSSQATFNALFTRTAANTYKMADSYRSVYFKYVEGGYSVTPLLSGGDTWGDLYTNNASSVEFENGTYINFGSARGNITANTAGGYLRNVDIRGSGVVGAAVNSFYLQNNYVTFDNCKTSARNANVDFVGFQGSGTALHNTTSKYRDCSVYAIDGSDKIYGYKDCSNLSNCLVYDLAGGVDYVFGYHTCNQLSGCLVNTITSTNTGSSGYHACNLLSGCLANTISSTSNARGFYTCKQISGCQANTITSTDAQSYGFDGCDQISGCLASTITSTNDSAVGFGSCDQISGCQAYTISGAAGAGDVGKGFSICNRLSACKADAISGNVNEGFSNCTYGAALYTAEAANSGNDYIDTADASHPVHKTSTPDCWT